MGCVIIFLKIYNNSFKCCGECVSVKYILKEMKEKGLIEKINSGHVNKVEIAILKDILLLGGYIFSEE